MDIDGFYPSKCKRLLDMVTSMHRTVSKASSQRLPVKRHFYGKPKDWVETFRK